MDALSSSERIAIIGGRGTRTPFASFGEQVVIFASSRYRGAGEARRLIAAIKAGQIAKVVVLVRWISHSTSGRVRSVCQSQGVPCLFWPGGLSSLVAELEQ